LKESDSIKRIKVELLGESYTLKATENEQYILELVNYVEGKMQEIRIKNPYLSTRQMAVLGALNIADEFFKWKEYYESMLDIINESKK